MSGDPVHNPPHYTHLKPEPIEVLSAWRMDYLAGNVIKYVVRYPHKGGVEDLRKAREYLDRLIAREERK